MLPPQLGPSCKPLSHREDQASRPCREAFPGGTGAGSLAGRGPLREEVLAEEWHSGTSPWAMPSALLGMGRGLCHYWDPKQTMKA